MDTDGGGLLRAGPFLTIWSLATGNAPQPAREAPAPPASVQTIPIFAGGGPARQLQATWQDRSNNEDGFKIYRELVNSRQVLIVTTVPANTTTYTWPRLCEDLCRFGVSAFNSAGESSITWSPMPGGNY